MSEDCTGAGFETRDPADDGTTPYTNSGAEAAGMEDDWEEGGRTLLPVLRALLGAFGADSWLARHNRIEDLCFDWLEFRSVERRGTLRDFVDVLISHESSVSNREPGVLWSLAYTSISSAIRPALYPHPALGPVMADVLEAAQA